MLFNSYEFLFFFPVVVALFYLLPQRVRWLHLLIASCIFYAAFIPVYLVILASTIVIDYYAGILIEKSIGSKRRFYLIVSIITNVGILCVFKYYNFFIDNLNIVFKNLPLLSIALPVGLSFHTFQAMSYTIEVFRGNQKAEKHFGIYALYVMFFPQLVAGPIERPQNVLYQFHEVKVLKYNNISDGLKLMLFGFFKKVVIADWLAMYSDSVFNFPEQSSGLKLLIGAIFFSFQIFCDFSGYSDIALGSAQVMGFKLMTNFNAPYRALSVAEFWKRWHISLSTWFKDYLYIPLGGNRVSIPRWYFNLFFVFLVSGFWHGANWTFIIWGALHGIYLILELIIDKSSFFKFNLNLPNWLQKFISRFITFSLVTFAWIFFRANSTHDAFLIVKKIFSAPINIIDGFKNKTHFFDLTGLTFKAFIYSILLILILEFIHALREKINLLEMFNKQLLLVRWGAYLVVIFFIIIFGEFSERQFIYFQF